MLLLKQERILEISDYETYEIGSFMHLTTDQPITVDLNRNQQAVILKTQKYRLNALTEIEEAILNGIIDQLSEAIQSKE